MSKPTPRPWYLFSSGGKVLAIMDANGKEIVHWSGFDSSHFPLSVQRENARLIVAAANRALNPNVELLRDEKWGLRKATQAKKRARAVKP